MSRVSLSGNPSGTGTFTIASPNSNTDRTLNLPDASGTLNTSGAPNEVPAGSAAAPAIYPAGDTNTGIFFPAADTIAFSEGGTESMRIDATGNMGLGVTPSAWASGRKVLQVSAGSGGAYLVSGSATQALLGANGYSDGSTFRYAANGTATLFEQGAGVFAWFTAPSGTAGNAITFTQAMTLNADRRWQLNTTTFVGNEQAIIQFNSSGTVTQALNTRDGNASANNNAHIVLRRSDDTYLGAVGRSGTDTAMFVDGNSYLALRTGNTERARIDSSGNLLVGTSVAGSPGFGVANSANISFPESTANTSFATMFRQASSADLVLGSGVRYSGTSNGFASSTGSAWARTAINVGYGAIKFFTAAEATVTVGTDATLTERARIDSSGNWLIGTNIPAGTSGSVGARKGGTGELILLANNGGLYQQAVSSYFLVTTAGGNTSDATLKKNVQQLSGALAKVCAIRGVNFEFIEEQKSTPDNGVQVGVIAQEVEAQYPEIVVTNEDGIKSVRYDRLVAPLIEAIKELKADLDATKAELAALKGQA